jgi:glycosyltransferase involved in cell wall biosynthesis
MPKRPRVLQLPATYLPWVVGGREVYAHHLSRNLSDFGWDVRVALHQDSSGRESVGEHRHEGVPVTVLPPLPAQNERGAFYHRRPVAAPGFAELLREFRPDIVHLHDFTIGTSLLHLEMSKSYGAKTVITYHTPLTSCLQGSLLYRGRTVCEGRIHPLRCTECRLVTAGLPPFVSSVLAAIPTGLPGDDSSHPLSRALTARTMTDRFRSAWENLIGSVDVIHVYADWAMKLMERNGVAPGKTIMFRTGGPWQGRVNAHGLKKPSDKLRLIYAGRCTRVKGVETLIKAVQRLPADVPIEVSFYGPYWEDEYGRGLLQMIRDDPRFRKPALVPNGDILTAYAQADVCVVPSVWLETGPLVVLEAFAAGTPVIGSRLGGIAELVRDGVDGLLFPPGDDRALSDIIRRLAEDRGRVRSLELGIRPPRTMTDVARDTASLYEELLANRRPGMSRLAERTPGPSDPSQIDATIR